MKTIPAAALALSLGAVLGVGAMATYASWEAQTGLKASVKSGAIHFAVDDPKPDSGVLQAIQLAGDSLSWKLPAGEVDRPLGTDGQLADILGKLSPAKPQSAVIRIDGQSQGNRGLAYSLANVRISGDPTLAERTSIKIGKVAEPSDCSPNNVGTPLYTGSLFEAKIAPRELVSAAYSTESWNKPVTEYLCLGFSLSADDLSYTNIATVTGTADGGLEADTELSASDSWSALIEPTQAARQAGVDFTFTHQTYRPGSEP
ncbi:hypothetical protein CQ018_01960 [Arthrobacter sp. MYb227]|uniref:hypothetical protein n=1 Tax=Arthrobacter sp. MYb227 TaxID=1848601 RepID=UPI000CFC939A|nr:hypothetical protein [Arthrobacter sp. MYb227]PQZ96069.1 hypothetical protein CQ018_01960 [Arthrobacter sp. MYb227]